MSDLPERPSHSLVWTDRATFVVLVIVIAMLLGVSPGLSLIAVALTVLLLDAFSPAILDSVMAHTRP